MDAKETNAGGPAVLQAEKETRQQRRLVAHQKRIKDIRAENELKGATLKAGLPWPPPGYKSTVGKPPADNCRGGSGERGGSGAPDGWGTPQPALNGADDGEST